MSLCINTEAGIFFLVMNNQVLINELTRVLLKLLVFLILVSATQWGKYLVQVNTVELSCRRRWALLLKKK